MDIGDYRVAFATSESSYILLSEEFCHCIPFNTSASFLGFFIDTVWHTPVCNLLQINNWRWHIRENILEFHLNFYFNFSCSFLFWWNTEAQKQLTMDNSYHQICFDGTSPTIVLLFVILSCLVFKYNEINKCWI